MNGCKQLSSTNANNIGKYQSNMSLSHSCTTSSIIVNNSLPNSNNNKSIKNDTLLDRKAFISLEKSINWQSLLLNNENAFKPIRHYHHPLANANFNGISYCQSKNAFFSSFPFKLSNCFFCFLKLIFY